MFIQTVDIFFIICCLMILFQKKGRAVVTDTLESEHLGSLRRFTMPCGSVWLCFSHLCLNPVSWKGGRNLLCDRKKVSSVACFKKRVLLH